jgi:hypothetical protein
MTEGWDGDGVGQYSHPTEEELSCILAREEIDLKKAQAGDAAAAERYRYRGIEGLKLCRSDAVVNVRMIASSIPELVKQGERIIDWIWRWSTIPLLGPILMSYLADQLDRLTDQLDTAVKPDTTNSN